MYGAVKRFLGDSLVSGEKSGGNRIKCRVSRVEGAFETRTVELTAFSGQQAEEMDDEKSDWIDLRDKLSASWSHTSVSYLDSAGWLNRLAGFGIPSGTGNFTRARGLRGGHLRLDRKGGLGRSKR